MYTITKRLNNYPFGHRQWRHDGHCRHVHGHNWHFEIEIQAEALDEQGFIFDFGKFAPVKEYLKKMFDHTLVLNSDDPKLGLFIALEEQDLVNLKLVPSCSCEGIAEQVYEDVNAILTEYVPVPFELVRVTVFEDDKNSATYYSSTS